MEFGNVQKYLKNNPQKLALLLIAITSFWVSSNVNWGKQRPQHIIKADGKGYYAHLPALFIYQDLNFGFFDSIEVKKYYQEPLYYDYTKSFEGKVYNKYFLGTAILMAPFFAVAHTYSIMAGLPADGYANIYHIWINIGATCYLLVSLFYCGRLLQRFKISNGIIALIFLIFYFGTNWFYWTNFEPGVSHVYSAALIPAFIFYFLRFTDRAGNRYLYFASLLFGLILLVRPVNVLVILAIPLFYSNLYSFYQAFKSIFKKPVLVVMCVLLLLGLVSLQPILYYFQTGKFVLDGYAGERFYFNNPHFIDFLISYKKGLFVYTPVLLFGLLGLVKMFKKHPFFVVHWSAFFTVLVYILSSWHCWWYGGGFGTRVMIEYYIFWMIPMAYLLRNTSKITRNISLTMLTVLVLYCQFQTFQYRYNIIYWDGISKEEYWDIFLKLWF